uniref:Uncharacterized protein n=1 Tax=Xiphophorus maculatus TaxID=8083 RepID=A0A3B5R8T5_XIPMA
MRFCLLLIGSITCAAQKPGNNQTNMNSNQALGGYPMWQHMPSSQHGQVGSGSYGSYGSTHGTQQGESWSSSSGTGGEDEPVFTPSKSRYNRKQLRFGQFHPNRTSCPPATSRPLHFWSRSVPAPFCLLQRGPSPLTCSRFRARRVFPV